MTIRTEQVDGVAYVTIARPEVRNAFDAATIAKLTGALREVDREARAVVVRGEGEVFCAGADVRWMIEMGTAPEGQNVADAEALAALFAAFDDLPMPVVGRVQGAAVGGGAGLVAACDIVIAAADAWFQFGEVRVGIVPAVVSPYVIRKMGPAHALAVFVTGERFDAQRALATGLVQRVVPRLELDDAVTSTLSDIRRSSPEAVRVAKRLVREVAWRSPAEVRSLTIRTIAAVRATAEARDGLAAFLERREPRWSTQHH